MFIVSFLVLVLQPPFDINLADTNDQVHSALSFSLGHVW